MKLTHIPLTIQAELDYSNLPPERKVIFLEIYQSLCDFIDLGIATQFGATGVHTQASRKTLYRLKAEDFDIIFYLTPQTNTPSILTIFYKEGQSLPI